MALNFPNILNFTMTTWQISFMHPSMDILGEYIWFSVLDTAQEFLGGFSVILQMSYGLIS